MRLTLQLTKDMEDYKSKLAEDAQRIAEFSQEHKYLSDAFFSVFGQRLMEEGYVDGRYGRGLRNRLLEVFGFRKRDFRL